MWAYGARREGRTPTLLREPDFESGASASSAIRAKPKSRGATSNMKSNKGQSSKAPGYPSFIWRKGGARILENSASLKGGLSHMTEVQCVTCGQAGEPITDPLFMGKLEAEIKSKVCKPCWKKWESMRVMVINEYQVNLGDESGRELVKKQMKAFLKLDGEQADTSKLDQNYRPQS
jgi:Fe-S cluster biosynthesis and repair protein YggX